MFGAGTQFRIADTQMHEGTRILGQILCKCFGCKPLFMILNGSFRQHLLEGLLQDCGDLRIIDGRRQCLVRIRQFINGAAVHVSCIPGNAVGQFNGLLAFFQIEEPECTKNLAVIRNDVADLAALQGGQAISNGLAGRDFLGQGRSGIDDEVGSADHRVDGQVRPRTVAAFAMEVRLDPAHAGHPRTRGNTQGAAVHAAPDMDAPDVIDIQFFQSLQHDRPAVIALFCLENLDCSAHSEDALEQLAALGFVGSWNADLSAFGEAYAGVELSMSIDENGHGVTTMNGEQTADFEAFALDNGEKDDGAGLYVAFSNLEGEAEAAPYTLEENADGDTVLTFFSDEGAISWIKAA